MEYFFLFFIIAVIIQWYMKTRQTKRFHNYYREFLQEGNVLVERYKGIFSGAIVMFQLDGEANIQRCMLMKGASFFAPWRECNDLINKNLLELKQDNLVRYEKSARRAINNAIKNYSKEEV